ncbi:inosine-5-monophosphate dehydrogenase [Thermococcus sp. P6]|uniref:CBS domain-containing protein n=1 Tax=Thermococcus sp. P6 TaxID=122420 RepID=UPI000B59CD76|nr:CBS domain-containing protein [Thermococcus sp. P6]ASJ10783.1 inosine-5-monophosphate dehydrogenase [Thermococcus sp. P6]
MVIIPHPVDPRVVRRIRKELGMTQEELAKKAGVTQAYIAKLEIGKVDPRLSTFNRILQALLECKRARFKARDVMSSPVISVKPYDVVEKVIRIMNEHNISQIPVISGNKVVGSVTERTLVRQSLEYEDIYDRKVMEVMADPFPIVNENDELEIVKYLLEEHPAVLVQDRRGKIVGIITRVDIFRLGK